MCFQLLQTLTLYLHLDYTQNSRGQLHLKPEFSGLTCLQDEDNNLFYPKKPYASWILNTTEDREIRPKDAPLFPYLICMDTVYREDVFTAIKQLPEFIQNPDYVFYTMFGHNNDLKVYYTHEMIYKAINFPWQVKSVKNDLIL